MNDTTPPASELFVTQFLVVSDQDRSRDFYQSVFGAEVGQPARGLTLPPPPAGPPDFAALAQAAARHQITILAPPPQP